MSEQNTNPIEDDNTFEDDDALPEDHISTDEEVADEDMSDLDAEDELSEEDETITDDVESDETERDESDIPMATTFDEIDVDAALAAVSQLTLLSDSETQTVLADDDDDVIEPVAFERASHADEPVEIVDDFHVPRHISMSRGQLASVLPAFTLIVLGGWLTFTLTTNNTTPSSGLLFSVVLIGMGAIFLSQWLTSGRWSRGNFFFGSLVVLIGGIELYLSQFSTQSISNSWTLWIIAVGIALVGTGSVTLPRLPRLSLMGILTVLTGIIGYILTSGAIDITVVQFIGDFWVVGAVILGILLLAPVLRRRQ